MIDLNAQSVSGAALTKASFYHLYAHHFLFSGKDRKTVESDQKKFNKECFRLDHKRYISLQKMVFSFFILQTDP